MKINLRKAVALQQEIQKQLKNTNLSSLASVRLNEHESVSSQMDAALGTFFDAVNTKEQLTDCLYVIRSDVATANSTAGVGVLLTEIARLDAKMKDYQDAISAGVQMSDSVIAGTLNKIKKSNADGDSSRLVAARTGITTTVLTSDYIISVKEDIVSCKRKRQDLKDQLLELNIKTQIEISPTVFNILTATGIL